jgi:O-antigen/teichoic acid export membrane protein
MTELMDAMEGTALVAEEEAAVVAPMSLRTRALRGSFWTIANYGTSNLFRLGSNLVLTRLLFPQVFGLMTLMNVFFQGLHMFSDVGIAPSIIQSPLGEETAFLNTAWTIQLFRGFMLWFASCMLAYPFARIYAQPGFVWMIPVAGFAAVIDGFTSTKYYSVIRHLNLGMQTILDLGAQVLCIVIMIIWAHYSATVWALIGGSLISGGIKCALTHVAFPGVRNRIHWDRQCSQALFKFGRWIFVSTVLTFLAQQMDRIVLGKVVPMALLGVYSIAQNMAGMPTQAILRIAGPITFSLYSRLSDSRDRLSEVFNRVRIPLLTCGGWAVSCVIVVGPLLIHTLYDNRYADAGWILQFLVIGAWFEILETTNGSALMGMGMPRWLAAGHLGKLVGMAIFVPIGFHWHGFAGALAGLVASEMCRYAVSVTIVVRQGLGVLWRDLFLCLCVGVTSSAALFVGSRLQTAHPHSILPEFAALLTANLLWLPMLYQSYLILRPRGPAATAGAVAIAG